MSKVNTNSTTPRGCDGCSRDLGFTMNALAITHRGRRYEVCGPRSASPAPPSSTPSDSRCRRSTPPSSRTPRT